MNRIRQLFFLILGVQLIVLIIGIPEYIPSVQTSVNQTVFFGYILAIIMFMIMVCVVIYIYAGGRKPFIDWLKPIGICMLSATGIFFGMILALLSTDQGLLGSHRYVMEYKYKTVDATVYVYDDSFIDPAFSIMVRNKPFPSVRKIYTSANNYYDNSIWFDENKDCLYIYEYDDTITIDSKKIMQY